MNKIVENAGTIIKFSMSNCAGIFGNGKAGYVTLLQPSSVEHGIYFPAQSLTMVVETAERAKEIAQLFLEMAESMEGNG